MGRSGGLLPGTSARTIESIEEAAVSDEVEPIELEIPPVEFPHEPEPTTVVPPAQYLTAPEPRPRARQFSPAVTGRDLKSVGLGALIVGVVVALAWFAAPPAPRVG